MVGFKLPDVSGTKQVEYKELELGPGESEGISFSAFTIRHMQCIRKNLDIETEEMTNTSTLYPLWVISDCTKVKTNV